jgi:Domain of unknown function (DUF4214)
VAFLALVRSEFVAASDRVSAALRKQVPVLDAAPDEADAWVFGLYATMFGRLPDAGGLRAFSEILRRGASPRSAAESLVHSDEGVSGGASLPENLDEAFVTGAYMTIFGRAPDPTGMDEHLELIRAHGSYQSVLEGLMSSGEAQRLMRFPPAPVSRGRLIGEALQTVLYSRARPDEALTQIFAVEYAKGVGTRRLARVMLRRDRNPRGVLRSLFVTRATVRLVEVEATARGARLEALANRRWQWRVDRKSWRRTDRIAARVNRLTSVQGAPSAVSDGPR